MGAQGQRHPPLLRAVLHPSGRRSLAGLHSILLVQAEEQVEATVQGRGGAVVTMVEWTWLLHSHLCGRGLDAPVGDQGPVAPGAGVEGALFCLTVDFHQEGLMIQFLVLVG